MKTQNTTAHSPMGEIWEDIVDDLLEIWCSVETAGRTFLCDSLRACRISADSTKRLSSFSIARLVVVIHEGAQTDECWLYDPKQKKIRKFMPV